MEKWLPEWGRGNFIKKSTATTALSKVQAGSIRIDLSQHELHDISRWLHPGVQPWRWRGVIKSKSGRHLNHWGIPKLRSETVIHFCLLSSSDREVAGRSVCWLFTKFPYGKQCAQMCVRWWHLYTQTKGLFFRTKNIWQIMEKRRVFRNCQLP